MQSEQSNANMEEPGKHNLRNFILVGLGSITLVLFVISTLIHRLAVDNLVRIGESKNITLASSLSHDVWSQYSNRINEVKDQPQSSVAHAELYRQLQQAINLKIKGTSTVKVKIYDLDAMTLYSSDTKQIGEKKTKVSNISRALSGEVVSQLAFRDLIYANEEMLVERNIISSYVPLSEKEYLPGKQVDSVIEIYSDVSEIYQQVVETRNNVIVIIAIAMLLLFSVLLVFVRRAYEISGWHLQEKKKDEQRMRHIAYHDSLTGLPNREMFRLNLETAMARAERNERLIAVLFLDLDRFKTINDSLGHVAGDDLLKEVAQKLLDCVRVTDTVARLGGDEFTIILDNVIHVEEVEEVAKRILESLSEPCMIDGKEIVNSVSIGITIYPLDERDIDQLLTNADAAMYEAKASGRDNYLFYSVGMNQESSEKLDMERKLRIALEENEYLLQYQPIVDLCRGNMIGVEALLRWNNEEYGIVTPDRFIPILEETGFISIVGDWVLLTACRKAVEWQKSGFAPMTMSVNISVIQFRRLEFVDSVRHALQESGLDAKYLKVEITESTLMDQSDACLQKLNAIRELGVSIAADDFGTGYSSLSYLKKLPIDILKIDRSFITDVHKSSDSAAIVTAITALAHSLKLGVIAEGVEEIEELNFLAALSCNYIQGYFFSRPLSENDLIEVMKNKHFFLDKLDVARKQNLAAASG